MASDTMIKADMSPDKFTKLKTLLSTFLTEESKEPEHKKADGYGTSKIMGKDGKVKDVKIYIPTKEEVEEEDERERNRPDSHVDLAKVRDQLEKQIINTSSPQKQKELRLKLSKIEDQLHSRGDGTNIYNYTPAELKQEIESVKKQIEDTKKTTKPISGLVKYHGELVAALNHPSSRKDAMTTDAKLATLGRMVHTLHKRMRMK